MMRTLKFLVVALVLSVICGRAWNTFAPPLGATVEARIVDADGRQVPNADVSLLDSAPLRDGLVLITPWAEAWLRLAGRRRESPHWAAATTDAQGHVLLGAVGPGAYELNVRAHGLAAKLDLSVDALPIAVVVPAVPSARIAGVVLDYDDRACPKVKVALQRTGSHAAQPFVLRTTTDAEGRFAFDDLPPGPYAVFATETFRGAEAHVTAPALSVTLKFELPGK